MKQLFFLLFLAAALLFGLKMGKKESLHSIITSEKEFPIKDRKTFVFLVYAYNQDSWVERTLQSIFEQEYDYYRVVFIDDGSTDATFGVASSFVAENNQEGRVVLIRNEEKLGLRTCLEQTIDQLLDQEIAIPLLAKDWLSHGGVLTRMNEVFQNPDVWLASSSSVTFPSYEILPSGLKSFYAALFKQMPSSGRSLESVETLAKGRTRHLNDVLFFNNQTI